MFAFSVLYCVEWVIYSKQLISKKVKILAVETNFEAAIGSEKFIAFIKLTKL